VLHMNVPPALVRPCVRDSAKLVFPRATLTQMKNLHPEL
jgi:hypothetical protein